MYNHPVEKSLFRDDVISFCISWYVNTLDKNMNNADTSQEKPLKNLWSDLLSGFIQMNKSFLHSIMCDDGRWIWIKLFS